VLGAKRDARSLQLDDEAAVTIADCVAALQEEIDSSRPSVRLHELATAKEAQIAPATIRARASPKCR
jgi:hypothetical protein